METFWVNRCLCASWDSDLETVPGSSDIDVTEVPLFLELIGGTYSRGISESSIQTTESRSNFWPSPPGSADGQPPATFVKASDPRGRGDGIYLGSVHAHTVTAPADKASLSMSFGASILAAPETVLQAGASFKLQSSSSHTTLDPSSGFESLGSRPGAEAMSAEATPEVHPLLTRLESLTRPAAGGECSRFFETP